MSSVVGAAREGAQPPKGASEKEARKEEVKEGITNVSSIEDKQNFMRKKKWPKGLRKFKKFL